MPIYEFLCRKCGNRFEELLAASESATARLRCPNCRSEQTERALSTFATGSGGTGGHVHGSGCGGGGFT